MPISQVDKRLKFHVEVPVRRHSQGCNKRIQNGHVTHFDSLQVPISQESESTIIPSTSSDDVPQNPLSREDISSVIEQKLAEALKRTLPGLIRDALIAPDSNNSPNVETNEGEPIAKRGKVHDENAQLSSATLAVLTSIMPLYKKLRFLRSYYPFSNQHLPTNSPNRCGQISWGNTQT